MPEKLDLCGNPEKRRNGPWLKLTEDEKRKRREWLNEHKQPYYFEDCREDRFKGRRGLRVVPQWRCPKCDGVRVNGKCDC